jgi:DNA-binding MarR family transcriptional regulator
MSSNIKTQFELESALETGRSCACNHLRRAARAVTQLYDDTLRPTGLRATQFTLLTALRIQGPISLNRLAEQLVMDRTTLTRNLRPLEKKELVRIEAGRDRRTREASLTKRGHQALVEAFPLWRRAQARVAGGLGDERLQALLGELGAVVEETVAP